MPCGHLHWLDMFFSRFIYFVIIKLVLYKHTYGGAFCGILACLLILFLVKWFSVNNILRKSLCSYKGRMLLFALTEVWIVNFYTDLGIDGFDSQDMVQALLFMITIILTVLVLIISLIKKSLESEKQLLDVRNKAVEQQYQELRKAYEQNRCLIHDEKHMVQYIEECLQNNDADRALSFLEAYQVNMRAQSRHSWTGIPTVDFIINMKNARMEELSVDFNVKVQMDAIPINEADFVVLLGNLFDNAIEAAAKCPIGNRMIKLQMQIVNAMLLIRMQNASVSAPSKKRGRFLTSKKDAENHGWGIESIKHIVKKYDGDIDFIYDTSKFEVQIMIQINNI